MIVAHRILLLPNNEQTSFFSQACGVARHTWNWAYREWNRQSRNRNPRIIDDYGTTVGYEKRKPVDDAGTLIQSVSGLALKKEFLALIDVNWPWMRIVPSHVYHQPFADLQSAWNRCYKGLAKKPVKKYKGKAKDSFYLANTCITIEGRHVKIAKLGEVRLREELRFVGRIMSARISRTAGQWSISVAVEVPDVVPVHDRPTVAVGVDLGVNTMAALSTGEMRENPRALSKHEKKLKRLQRKLSRQLEAAKVNAGIPEGKPIPRGTHLEVSGRMQDTRLKIQRAHHAITGLRSNAQHQLSAELTKRFGVIAIEDLNVKGMTASAKGDMENPGKRVAQKSGLNRGILDVGFGELRRQLDYKSKRSGTQLVVINRWFPSSKTCSVCGVIQESMPLNIRKWVCPSCGTPHDRDINAAQNIKRIGVIQLQEPSVEKVIKRIGKLNPGRKKVSERSENTAGAAGINGRGDNGSVVDLSTVTSIVETSTGHGADLLDPEQCSNEHSFPSPRRKLSGAFSAQADFGF